MGDQSLIIEIYIHCNLQEFYFSCLRQLISSYSRSEQLDNQGRIKTLTGNDKCILLEKLDMNTPWNSRKSPRIFFP